MYIPIWILMVVIVGAAFYYFSKKQKEMPAQQKAISQSNLGEADKDWLDDENWKEIMLQHLSKYPQRTGKNMPTYDEILKLDEDEFKAWLFVMANSDHEKDTLEQMIDHEERTHSFEKTKREDASVFTKAILDVFRRERSKEIVDLLKRVDESYRKGKHEEGECVDIVKQALWAKANSDYFGLGKKNEKERSAS